MKCLRSTALLLAFLCSSSQAVEPAAVAASLTAQVKQALGVDIRQLGLLFEANPGDFHLVDALRDSGELTALEDLEQKGYLVIRIMDSAQGELANISLTEKGKAVRSALADF